MCGKSKGDQFCFELAGNSRYRVFELSGFNCNSNITADNRIYRHLPTGLLKLALLTVTGRGKVFGYGNWVTDP